MGVLHSWPNHLPKPSHWGIRIQHTDCICVCVCVCVCARVHVLSHSVVSDSAIPCTVACQGPLSVGFPSKNTGVGCHFLLQGIFLTQGSKPHLLHLLHWQADSLLLYHLQVLGGHKHSIHTKERGWINKTVPCSASRWHISEEGVPHKGKNILTCVCAKSLQSCLTLCDPMDCSPPGSSVHGILQARILEWVVKPSSRGSSRPRDRISISYISCVGRWVLYN